MSYVVKVKIDGESLTVFNAETFAEANRLKVWLKKHSPKSEKVWVVPTRNNGK